MDEWLKTAVLSSIFELYCKDLTSGSPFCMNARFRVSEHFLLQSEWFCLGDLSGSENFIQ